MDLDELFDDEMTVLIEWKKKTKDDYLKLSKQYIDAAKISTCEILKPHGNNRKYDMWFLASVYMMRQAIELLLKSGIAKNITSKPELQTIFFEKKHNINELYSLLKECNGIENLTSEQEI